MSVECRILQVGEEDVLARVAVDVFDDPVVPRAAGEFLADPRHHLAVAIDNGVVVGFVSGVHYIHPDKAHPEFWINEVGVAATHHRQGIAKTLMGLMLARARELGCAEAWVLTERDNTPAMGLYRALKGDEDVQDTVMFTFILEES